MSWIILAIASIFEVFWATSLKFLSFTQIKKTIKTEGLWNKITLKKLIPLFSYIFFGIANVFCFTTACKELPLTVAFAVWMGLAMVLQTMVDRFLFKESFTKKQYVFIVVLLIGIIGLKLTS